MRLKDRVAIVTGGGIDFITGRTLNVDGGTWML